MLTFPEAAAITEMDRQSEQVTIQDNGRRSDLIHKETIAKQRQIFPCCTWNISNKSSKFQFMVLDGKIISPHTS
jgi:hypothetical protein